MVVGGSSGSTSSRKTNADDFQEKPADAESILMERYARRKGQKEKQNYDNRVGVLVERVFLSRILCRPQKENATALFVPPDFFGLRALRTSRRGWPSHSHHPHQAAGDAGGRTRSEAHDTVSDVSFFFSFFRALG